MDKWIDFYAPFFENREKARQFVENLEKLDVNDVKYAAKIMMHQAQRLVSLADDLPQIRAGKESLQLLFLIICAEHISKLHANFNSEGQSKKYTGRFFEELVIGSDQNRLISKFKRDNLQSLNLGEIVDLLYDVRCDVVHEGKDWEFHFHDGHTPMMIDPDVIVYMRLQEFRDIVIRGCINAVKTYRI